MNENVLKARESTSVAHAPRGVPRRFGLGMLFVWTTLFSVALVGADALETPWPVVLVLSILVVLVGIVQWFFGEGHKARAASVLLGAVYTSSLTIIVFVADGGLPRLAWSTWLLWIGLGLSWSLIGGGIIGYLTGTLVAGVFLVAFWIDRGIALWRGRSIAYDWHAEFDTPDSQEPIDQPSGTG